MFVYSYTPALKNPTPYKGYNGGKSGAGTYQFIINHIPPLRVYMALFAGNDGVFKHMRRAEWTVLNDISPGVMDEWRQLGLELIGDVRLYRENATFFLKNTLNTAEYKRLWKHTFIFLDPPYLKSTRKSKTDLYEYEMNETEHEWLLQGVLDVPEGVKVMITHYPCELYDRMLSGWKTIDFKNTTRGGQVTERLYMNYELDGSLHDYQYIGINFRQREKYKRIKTNLFAKLDRMEPLLRNAFLQEYELLQHRTNDR